MDRGTADAGRSGVAGRLLAGRWTVVASGLVFAAGAFLALQLIEPRYEAHSVILTDGQVTADDAARPSSLVALVSTPAFASAVAARLGEGPWARPAPSLPDRIVEILEGASVREAVREPEHGIVESVSVERGAADGEISVTALAGNPRDARHLADAVAAELVSWIAGPPQPAVVPQDDGALESQRTSVRALSEALAALPAVRMADPAVLADQRERVARSGRELGEAIAAADEQLEFLEALASDPAAPGSLENLLPDGALRRALDDYRRLAASVEDLGLTLLDGHPRLRIARLRLDDLGAEIAASRREAVLSLAAERDALRLRLNGVEEEAAGLEDTASNALAATQRRAALERELADAEERLAVLESEALAEAEPQPRPQARVVSAGQESQPREAPVLLVTALAGFSGLLAGAGGVILSTLVARPVRAGAALPAPTRPARALPEAPADTPPVVTLVPRSISTVQDEPAPPLAIPAARRDTVSLDDVAAALLASPVSRALIVSASDAACEPASLLLARNLAEKGNLVLLVDLSADQAAARLAGVPAGGIGFHEIATGQVGLSGVAVGDEDSAADIVSGGRVPDSISGRAGAEALHYARKAYDHVLVDCGRLSAADIIGLADEECAILLPVEGVGDETLSDRLRELAAAGLDTVILIG